MDLRFYRKLSAVGCFRINLSAVLQNSLDRAKSLYVFVNTDQSRCFIAFISVVHIQNCSTYYKMSKNIVSSQPCVESLKVPVYVTFFWARP